MPTLAPGTTDHLGNCCCLVQWLHSSTVAHGCTIYVNGKTTCIFLDSGKPWQGREMHTVGLVIRVLFCVIPKRSMYQVTGLVLGGSLEDNGTFRPMRQHLVCTLVRVRETAQQQCSSAACHPPPNRKSVNWRKA